MSEQRQSRFELGLNLLEGGHYEEARGYLEASLEKEGYSEECYLAYANVSAFLSDCTGDRHEGDDEYEELAATGLIAADQGIRLLQRGRYGRAIHKLREAVEVVPELAVEPLLIALTTKANQYMERRLFRKAILLYDECLGLEADNPQTYYLRAWAHFKAGNMHKAHVDQRRAQAGLLEEVSEGTTSRGQETLQIGEDEDPGTGVAATGTDRVAASATTIRARRIRTRCALSDMGLKGPEQVATRRYGRRLFTNCI